VRRLLLLVTASAVVLSACSGGRSRLKVGKGSEGEVVEAEGLAPNDPKDVVGTKRASLVWKRPWRLRTTSSPRPAAT
jgi:hypothetical protein